MLLHPLRVSSGDIDNVPADRQTHRQTVAAIHLYRCIVKRHKFGTAWMAGCVNDRWGLSGDDRCPNTRGGVSYCAVLVKMDVRRACSSVRAEGTLEAFQSVPFSGLLSGLG